MNEKLFMELECSLLDPKVRKSTNQLEIYISKEFLEFGSSGKIYNYADTISSLPGEKAREIEVLNFRINQLSRNVVLATYTSLENNIYTLRFSIWKKTNRIWKMVFHQGTKINK